MRKNLGFYILGLSIFLGLSSLGFLIGNSLLNIKKLDRTVTVKGLAEKEVTANTVIWPITFRVTANTLPEIYSQIEKNNEHIISFLSSFGIEKKEITLSQPNINDKMLYQYDTNSSIPRYTATQTLTVYSNKVAKVHELTGKIGELVKENISLTTEYPNTNISYGFSNLNNLKPEMIEIATKNARSAALKFAKDSKSSLGKIKSASQGYFTITSRDEHNPQIKSIRVVTTVEYYLVD